MGLLWPWILARFALTPLVLWLYRRALTPPSKSNLYFGDLALVERAGAEGGALRRHLPALSYRELGRTLAWRTKRKEVSA